MRKNKKRFFRFVCLLLLSSILSLICVRISIVNSDTIYDYYPNRVYVSNSQEIPLQSGPFYYSFHDWTGYTIEISDTQITETPTFFQEHGGSLEDLSAFGFESNNHHAYDYICIVSVVFRYYGADSRNNDPIDLEEFKLIGENYIFDSAPILNKLNGFNDALQGNSRFRITSGKPIEIDIPFLISSGYEIGIDLQSFISSPPYLLVNYYPDEICISVF